MKSPDDQKLLHRAKQLQPEALAMVYDLYSTPVYRYAHRLLGDNNLAEDCVADVFDRFLTAMNQGGGPQTHLRAYLYRMAHNWIVDHYRKNTNMDVIELPEFALAKDDTARDASDRLEKQYLRQMVMRLPDEQRQVVILRYLEQWSLEEVAEAMNKTVGAVKALQHRALASLQRLWDEKNEGSNE